MGEPQSQDTMKLGSQAEDLFIEIFTEVFGIENTKYLPIQQSFVDYYGNYRYIDFALENKESKIAIEIATIKSTPSVVHFMEAPQG